MEREKKYYIIIHNVASYRQHRDAIGLPIKKDALGKPILDNGNYIPKHTKTSEIKIDDEIFYYCPSPIRGFMGLFKITGLAGMYYSDWINCIQFKLAPIKDLGENDFLSFYDIKDKLPYFKNPDGTLLEPLQISMKLRGSIKELSLEDANIIKREMEIISAPSPTPPVLDNRHLDMILLSHNLSGPSGFISYIGTQERNRVSDRNDEEIFIQQDLPDWLKNLAISQGTRDLQNIQQIDNIWFIEEPGALLVPTVAFEHERTNDLRDVMDRFITLKKILNLNSRFRNIKPIYIIVAENEDKRGLFERKIEAHSEWNQFKNSEAFKIFILSDLTNRTDELLETIASLYHRVRIQS